MVFKESHGLMDEEVGKRPTPQPEFSQRSDKCSDAVQDGAACVGRSFVYEGFDGIFRGASVLERASTRLLGAAVVAPSPVHLLGHLHDSADYERNPDEHRGEQQTNQEDEDAGPLAGSSAVEMEPLAAVVTLLAGPAGAPASSLRHLFAPCAFRPSNNQAVANKDSSRAPRFLPGCDREGVKR